MVSLNRCVRETRRFRYVARTQRGMVCRKCQVEMYRLRRGRHEVWRCLQCGYEIGGEHG